MKRIRKFVKKLKKAREYDHFAEQWDQSMTGVVEKTRDFAEELHLFGVNEAVKDLLSRIERLEAELHPLRNGQPLRRPTYRD